MNELQYLKETFLDSLKSEKIFASEDESVVSVLFFQEQIDQLRDNCIKSEDIKAFKESMRIFNRMFVTCLNNIDSEKHSALYYSLFNMYDFKGFRNIDEWVEKQQKHYQENYTPTSVKIDNILAFFNLIDKKEPVVFTYYESPQDVREYAKKIMTKYNLKMIDLGQAANNSVALEFLKTFDKNTTDFCIKMNMKFTCIGLDNTLSLAYTDKIKCVYNAGSKQISLNHSYFTHSSDIAHEWFHALDNKICQDATNKNDFTTHVQEHYISTSDNKRQAFHTLRELTKHIMSDDHENISSKIQSQKMQIVSQFFHSIYPNEWYTLEEDKRQKLFSNDMIDAIYNFNQCVKSGDVVLGCEELLETIENITQDSIFCRVIEHSVRDKCEAICENIAPEIKKLNANIMGQPSKYFKLANWSEYSLILDNFYQQVENFLFPSRKKDEMIKGNIKPGYYTEPCELAARYFEKQLYPKRAKQHNISSKTMSYPLREDKNFNIFKDKLMGYAFRDWFHDYPASSKTQTAKKIKTMRIKNVIQEYTGIKLT